MAKDITSEKLLAWTFYLTMAGTVLYVLAVAVFVLGAETEDLVKEHTAEPE